MAASDSLQKKRNNYKLISDPELKKNAKKLYRLNGVTYRLNGKDATGFPPCETPKDPRTQKTVLGQAMEFKVPRFKYDKFWQGPVPERDVFVIGLNENVRGSLFKEVCAGLGDIHSVKHHLHPKTKTFLGASTVSFIKEGVGLTAMKELDGKIVGGCYLRAELDDEGEHLKRYLEPVLKKCSLDKKPPANKHHLPLAKGEGPSSEAGGSVSDSEGFRTRTSSIAESTCDLSESEVEGVSTCLSTPLTPTSSKLEFLTPTLSDGSAGPSRGSVAAGGRRGSEGSGHGGSSSSKGSDGGGVAGRGGGGALLYPFSSLSLIAGSSSSSSTPEMSGKGFSSPKPLTPRTPDSGISIRTHSTALASPCDPRTAKWASPLPHNPGPSTPSSAATASFPPLPPEENAPPLPPPDEEAPPPLPPPLPKELPVKDGEGIENISSDEEPTRKEGPSTPPLPVSPCTTGKPLPSFINPSIGLQTLLENKIKKGGPSPFTPYVASNSPLPSYELEVEEISGDESPVMVYFEPLKVESISEDEMDVTEGGGDDMDISDNENDDQENVIEVNVETASRSYPPGTGQMLVPQQPPHMQQHLHYNIPSSQSNFYPPPGQPPYMPPPPPPHLSAGYPLHPPPPPPPHGYHPHMPMFPPGGRHEQPHSPSHGHQRGGPRQRYRSPPRQFEKDRSSNPARHPNGYIGSVSRFQPRRGFNRSKLLRNFSMPKNRVETLSQDVLFKAFEQLRLILHNDVNKKIVESSAYHVLDEHWEKREKEKLEQKAEVAGEGERDKGSEKDKEKGSRPAEPYRRMMPGLKALDVHKEGAESAVKEKKDRAENDEEEEEEEEEMEEEEEEEERLPLPTPRKRRLNFKIPLLGGQRRDQQQRQSVVATSMRRLFKDEQGTKGESDTAGKSHSSRQGRGYYSDISSSEYFSSAEEDDKEEEEEEEGEEKGKGDFHSSAEEDDEEDSDGAVSTQASQSSVEENSDWNDVFRSSASDEDDNFEKFLESSKQTKKSSEGSDKSEDAVAKVHKKAALSRKKGQKGGRQRRKLKSDSDKLKKEVGTKKRVGRKKPKAEFVAAKGGGEEEVGEEEEEEKKEEVEVVAPCKPRYKRRSSVCEVEVLDVFLEEGLDKEDVQMFKLAMARLKDREDPLVDDVPWAHYPYLPLNDVPQAKKRRVSKYSRKGYEEDGPVHATGCARSEGYYKIDMRDKIKYLPHHKDSMFVTHTDATTASKQKTQVKSSGRKNRANQRKLASLYSAGDVSRDLAKYNQFKARKKQLKFAKSTIHNWGLFALESIPADEMVIEYVGEVVRQTIADEREKRYEAAGIGSSYLFRVDHDYIIDATHRGGLARFINHCCDPNCYAKVINFQTGKKIVIYSKRDIALGEEITYDYKFPIEDEKIPCLCGAPNCRGTLN